MKSVALKSGVLIVLGVAVAAIPVLSQAPAGARPQFEVVSVKLMPPPVTRIGISNQNGRFVATGFSLKMLVGRGYAVPETRIIGGPSWVESERYDIDAKAPAGAPAQLQPMIQTMLEDRFQLKVHKETRDLPVYELVVGRNGSKVKLSEDQTPPPLVAPQPLQGDGGAGLRGDPGAGPRGGGPFTAGPGGPVTPFGPGPRPRGTAGRGSNNGQLFFEGSAVPLTVLITTLNGQLGRPVIDKTGLTGLFDIRLEWVPGAEAPPSPFGPSPGQPPPPTIDGPSIFSAIQDQLGLRLEAAKAPLEVVVIDSAQKPSEN